MGSFVLPGQSMIPRGWGESVVLYSESGCAVVVDGAPPGPNGRLYKIPAGKPIKVPFEVGRHLLNSEGFPFLDVVQVQETETETGISYDIEGAKKASLERSAIADKDAFDRFVSASVEDRIKQNKPVPQPPDMIMAIIKRRGWKLEEYGIHPIGWRRPDDDRLTKLSAENELLNTKLAKLEALLEKKLYAKEAK